MHLFQPRQRKRRRRGKLSDGVFETPQCRVYQWVRTCLCRWVPAERFRLALAEAGLSHPRRFAMLPFIECWLAPYTGRSRTPQGSVNTIAHLSKGAKWGKSGKLQVASGKLQVVYLQPSTCNLPPATCHLQPATCNLPPATSSYRVPKCAARQAAFR